MRRDESYASVARGEGGWIKILHFTEPPYNFDIKGVIHVGANDGFEVDFYKRMGIENILLFEPLPSAVETLEEKYGKDFSIRICPFALGNKYQRKALMVGPAEGKSSSFVPYRAKAAEIDSNAVVPFVSVVEDIPIYRFDESPAIYAPVTLYDCLVIDVQGMELEVLEGFGSYLSNINFISVECSEKPIYQTEASAAWVEEWLFRHGFQRTSEIRGHDDVMYIRKSLLELRPNNS